MARSSAHRSMALDKIGCGCQNRYGIPFWGWCTTHFRTYFSGDWDVHWRYGILTHGHMPKPSGEFHNCRGLQPPSTLAWCMRWRWVCVLELLLKPFQGWLNGEPSGNQTMIRVRPCIFYCLLHVESLVKWKIYPKFTPETIILGVPHFDTYPCATSETPRRPGLGRGHLAASPAKVLVGRAEKLLSSDGVV